MTTTKLVNKTIGTTGYGLMGLTWRPKPQPIEDSIAVMKAALEKGSNFWNGGVFYGTPEYNSLHLLNAYFTKYPEDASKVVISIKGGADVANHFAPTGTRDFLRKEIDECLKILDGKCKIDIFECARVDQNTPIEDTIRYLTEMVEEGKIGGIGMSECAAKTIQRAASAGTIASVEVEFSLFSTDILTNDVAKVCAEHNIPVVAYSPLSRGFLTGQLRSFDDLPEDDMRRAFPRFSPENFGNNLKLVNEVEKVAKAKGCTPGNVAIAWIKALSGHNGLPTIIPIPGTTTLPRLEENMTDVTLSESDMKTLEEAVQKCEIIGNRYHAATEAHNWG
jgi:pyridoxine 4-dehydrogenase